MADIHHLRPWFPTHRDLGGVALRICNDACETGGRVGLHYGPRAAIEVVCFRRQSLANTYGRGPSYLWGVLGLDEDGIPSPEIDMGRLARMVWIPGHRGRKWRLSAPREIAENGGPWELLDEDGSRIGDADTDFGISADTWMLQTGLELGRRFLIRVTSEWYRCSYEYEEYDERREIELLYVEPHGGAPIYLPVHRDCP